MEHELDGLYLAKSDFDQSPKIKGIENLLEDLKRLFIPLARKTPSFRAEM